MRSDSSFAAVRQQMIRQQLSGRGIKDRRLLTAMAEIPRERFLDSHQQHEAYADRALPIGSEQTISQPYMVALMTQALRLTGRERVLEIGTGSGYQTAILARLANHIVSLERHPELQSRAATVLGELSCDNVELIAGDGALGWPPGAPFDRVLVTAAAVAIPPALLAQLAGGGLLVIPLGDLESQELTLIAKTGADFPSTPLITCRFVPLVGSFAPPQKPR